MLLSPNATEQRTQSRELRLEQSGLLLLVSALRRRAESRAGFLPLLLGASSQALPKIQRAGVPALPRSAPGEQQAGWGLQKHNQAREGAPGAGEQKDGGAVLPR